MPDNTMDHFQANPSNTLTILGGNFNISYDKEDDAGHALLSLMVKYNLLDSFREIILATLRTWGSHVPQQVNKRVTLDI